MKTIGFKPAFALSLLAFSCVQQQVQQRMTAEEAGWYGEVMPVVTAACSVKPPERVVVSYANVRCGYGENCPGGMRNVPLYGTRSVSLPAPSENGDQYWRDTQKRMTDLLPPADLAELHQSLLDTLAAQQALGDTQSKLTGDQRAAELAQIASNTCSQFAAFEQAVVRRQSPPKELLAQSFAISFQPVGSPATFGLNHKGEFFVSVSDSVQTPYGELSFSRAKSTASPTRPKRLVIRMEGRERVLFMDRDFEVFVPATHGMKIVNTDTELILDADAKLPIAEDMRARRRKSKRTSTTL